MTKGLKIWNTILMIVLVLVALSALVTAIYGAIAQFKITSLNSVKDFITNNLYFMVQGSGLYFVDNFLVMQITALAKIKFFILFVINLFLLIWAISMLVRIIKPDDHFYKFRTWTVVVNAIFALIALINLHWAFGELLNRFTVQSVIVFLATILIIAIFVIHLNMNLLGMAKLKEDEHIPNDIFPINNPQPNKEIVHPQANFSFVKEKNKTNNTSQSQRKAPPPPPPAQ